ncbi:MAG TPA: TIGR03435 family protein, partial [Bryobacteraceae bacterium]|nr:TIGR03435 family protein [Bryobacteraceae bacterium]
GRYDFLLTWTPDETQFGGLGVKVPPPTDKADAPPDLFTAIQQELGLKLESTKAQVDVLVVDKVEKPTEN